MSLDIVRLLEHVGIEKAHILGYSMGARIVGKLREMRPDVFISLTLGGYGLVKDDGPPPSVADLADSLERGGGFMPLYRELYPDWTDEAREARSAVMVSALPDVLGMVALLRGMRFRVSEESLRANTVPTLAIVGELDPRKQAADELVTMMRNLEVVVIPETDHSAASTHPLFLSSLLKFLERHPQAN
jgi:pimeloyl-ACP methyl ester carboxylesterase